MPPSEKALGKRKKAATDAGLEGFEDFGAATAAAASQARRQRESEIARA